MKLKNLMNENTDRLSSKNKKQVLEAISNFNAFGESIYSKSNMKEVVRSISELCENATKLALQEHDDWFDSVTVKRDMKEVAGILKEFVKASTESQSTQQRLESLYEDLGHKLGRYYDINEKLDAVGQEDGDVDNDGDEDDSDEYLAKKRAAISKAIKNESSTNLTDIISEHHALGVLPSSKLMKMKWNPLKEDEPITEGASEEEKRIAMNGVRRQAKYRSVDIATAIQDQIRALKDLAREQVKKEKDFKKGLKKR
tara:strand:- start:21612 stop:22379 length:768 start_codon:yes stop_codon:yes gene_type:complete